MHFDGESEVGGVEGDCGVNVIDDVPNGHRGHDDVLLLGRRTTSQGSISFDRWAFRPDEPGPTS
jgi:hypothetical protein